MGQLRALLITHRVPEFEEAFAFAWGALGGISTRREPVPLTFESIDPACFDAIAAYVTSREQVDWLLKAGLPVLNLSGSLNDPRIASLTVDQHAAGRLAAEHLLTRGFRHFAYLGYDHMPLSMGRESGFADRLRAAGRNYAPLLLGNADRQGTAGLGLRKAAAAVVARWLAGLPRPCALFGANDSLALLALEAARRTGRQVPDDLLILGMDNTAAATCSQPPISSIALPTWLLGGRCAALLAGAAAGHGLTSQVVPPLEIAVRASSNAFADDGGTLQAIDALLQAEASELTVASLATRLDLSTRQLNRRLRASCNTTAMALLRRARLRQARSWLESSGADLETIAQRSGFTSRQGLVKALHEEYGLSPAAFRRVKRGKRPNPDV